MPGLASEQVPQKVPEHVPERVGVTNPKAGSKTQIFSQSFSITTIGALCSAMLAWLI